jgi:hypothetical protein
MAAQRAISATFLKMTGESHHDQQIQTLLRNLEWVISERTGIDSPFTPESSGSSGHCTPEKPAILRKRS